MRRHQITLHLVHKHFLFLFKSWAELGLWIRQLQVGRISRKSHQSTQRFTSTEQNDQGKNISQHCLLFSFTHWAEQRQMLLELSAFDLDFSTLCTNWLIANAIYVKWLGWKIVNWDIWTYPIRYPWNSERNFVDYFRSTFFGILTSFDVLGWPLHSNTNVFIFFKMS